MNPVYSWIDSILQWKDLKIVQNSSLLLDPTPNLELFINRPENATLKKNNNGATNICFLNITVLTKCIILKYLIMINLCPYSL